MTRCREKNLGFIRPLAMHCKALAICLTTAFMASCDHSQIESSSSRPTMLIPRSVAALHQQGDLRLTLTVSGTQVYEGFWVPGAATAVDVDAALVAASANEVFIEFSFLIDAQSEAIALASARHLLPPAEPGTRITFPAILYRYADNDADGRYNVHELIISNRDVDNDGIANVSDSDSDSDGTVDGQDRTPYGGLLNATENLAGRMARIHLPDSTSRLLSIDHIVGDPQEVNHLVDTLGQASVQVPPTWPTSITEVNYFHTAPEIHDTTTQEPYSGGWTAFTLNDRNTCPDWRLSLDTTSISNAATQTVLLYFRLADQAPAIIPMGATSITDLDVYHHAAPFDGNGPLNNALRMILVPAYTLGWIELWTERSLAGTACSVNLATH